MTVLSGLGQPLSAEIDLVSVQEDELATLAAKLASPEMFREAQIQYPSHMNGLRFTVEKRANGQRYLKVVSGAPVNEPFIDVLVELSWSTGRLVKEFTALLDPLGDQTPRVDQSRIPQTQAVTSDTAGGKTGKSGRSYARKGSRVGEPAAPDQVRTKQPKPVDESSATQTPADTQGAPTPPSGDTYTVKAGDSLASIAAQLKPEGVNLDQMLAGLYRANENAFEGKNMNRLKAGRILNVPDKDNLASVSPADARKEVKTHSTDWHSYRQKVAEAVSKSPGESTTGSSASGKITGKVEDKATPEPTGNQDVVKLSRGETAKNKGAKAGAETKDLQSRINAMEEEATAREKALKEANERIASLQKNVEDMKKLVELKSKGGADLQSQAGGKSAKPEVPTTPPPAPVVETPKPAEPTPAPAPAEPSVPPSEPPAPSDGAQPPVEQPTPQPEPTPAPPPAPPKPAVVTPPPPPPEPTIMDMVFDNIALIGGGLVAVGAGVGALIWSRRRKRPSFEDSILTGSDLKANTVLGNTGGAIINTNATESSFLTDFSRAGLGTIDTDEVDPIAEAEVYMAYGRDAQAEEILKDALAKDASRQEIRLKLLEIYAARKNVSTFEDVATELYAAVEGRGPLWASASEMGRQLDPANPLYQQGAASPAKPAEPVATFEKTQVIDRNNVGPAAGAVAAGAAVAAVAAADLDFQLDLDETQAPTAPVPAPASAPAAAPMVDLDFSLPEVAPQPVAAPASAPAAGNLMDFDLGSLGQSEATSIKAAPVAELDIPTLNLDVPDLGGDFDLSLPEVAPAPAPAAAPKAALDGDSLLDFDFQLDAKAPAAEAKDASVLDLGDLDLNLDETIQANALPVADDGMDDADPMTTKIDLARAYLDMGDKEGAREILQEVLQDGSASQQQTAKALLEQL
ncbi:pilus assembly protein FimV [Chitinivorax tropicus]|uniref:Pilus assembly protein FimV n=1 Tax=Chitinivorax tropicus TaxID=714531 RepID=A0A840MPX7_9PROT|nr:FimV/HubP family polar landmark protein [Chitinivorax tropicus]MBB5018802.1 pilus assembly protein FimV [Chitinivorax tropicus]